MATEPVSSLEQSLSDIDVTSERVPPEKACEAIIDSVTEPAVAVPFDEYSVSLADAPVSVDPTPVEVRDATTGVTPAAFAVADYGSVGLPQGDKGSELVSLFVERHIAVLCESDIVPDMDATFDKLDKTIPDEFGDTIIATGPSATADMGALVKGAHGPRKVHVIVLEGV